MVWKEGSTIRRVLLLLLSIAAALFSALHCYGQDNNTARTQPKTPATTSIPDIPVAHLELQLKPLTKEELVVEADAWRDLLKAKLKEIAELQIAASRQKEAADQAAESADEKTDCASTSLLLANPIYILLLACWIMDCRARRQNQKKIRPVSCGVARRSPQY